MKSFSCEVERGEDLSVGDISRLFAMVDLREDKLKTIRTLIRDERTTKAETMDRIAKLVNA